jgi:Zn-dependent peptidase ImmA (M78 family)/transcriptional regulator with XRE-family HTH domain
MDYDPAELGQRLLAARVKNGWSQRCAAERSRVPQSTITRMERGMTVRETLRVLDDLAAAYGERLDHLLYGSPVRERVLAAARTVAPCDTESALARAVELLELDDSLDAVVPELRQQRVIPGITVPTSGTPTQRGKALAQLVREYLQLGHAPVTDLPALLTMLTGVDVGTAPLGRASGICAVDPDRDTALVLANSDDIPERQRFTLAHELGHLLFGDGAHVDTVDGSRGPAEIPADEFARCLLIPQDGLRSWLWQGLGVRSRTQVDERALALLARHFGVSPEVARIQLDRTRMLPAALRAVPSTRVLAHRYGWGQQYDVEAELAKRPVPPQRIQERATHAYRIGMLGLAALARLTGVSEADLAESFAEADIAPVPAPRRVDITKLVARARAAHAKG